MPTCPAVHEIICRHDNTASVVYVDKPFSHAQEQVLLAHLGFSD